MLCFYVARRNLLGSTRAGRRRSLLYFALLSVGAGTLFSCAGKEVPPQPQTVAVRPPHPLAVELPVHVPPVPRPAHKPNAPPSSDEAAAMTAENAPAQPSSLHSGSEPVPTSPGPAPSPSLQTSELIGLDQPAATRLFGPAKERSEQPPATVWRYKNATCELDLFFYLDLTSGSMRTLHYSLKGDGGDATRKMDCLKSFLVARND